MSLASIILLKIKILIPVGEGDEVGLVRSSKACILPGVRGTIGKRAEIVNQRRHMRKNKSREIAASTRRPRGQNPGLKQSKRENKNYQAA